jgi:hypothetical protein
MEYNKNNKNKFERSVFRQQTILILTLEKRQDVVQFLGKNCAKYGLDPDSKPKLFLSLNRNLNTSLRFQNTETRMQNRRNARKRTCTVCMRRDRIAPYRGLLFELRTVRYIICLSTSFVFCEQDACGIRELHARSVKYLYYKS